MANIYDAMVFALREHWKAFEGAAPQRFELTMESLKALNSEREAVIVDMNFTLRPGWEGEFHGAAVVLTEAVNCMVDKDGNRVLLGYSSSVAGAQNRRNGCDG